MTPAVSAIVHGGFIQFSGLYAFASECTAMEPSALNRINRIAGASRAPSRPSYVDRAARDEQPHEASVTCAVSRDRWADLDAGRASKGTDERAATTVTRVPYRAAVETLVADRVLVVAAQREAEG